MPWFSILSGLLKLAGLIADIVKERQLMDAGEARGLAKSLAGIAERAGIAREIEEETARMSPDQILRDLEGSGELRD